MRRIFDLLVYIYGTYTFPRDDRRLCNDIIVSSLTILKLSIVTRALNVTCNIAQYVLHSVCSRLPCNLILCHHWNLLSTWPVDMYKYVVIIMHSDVKCLVQVTWSSIRVEYCTRVCHATHTYKHTRWLQNNT